MAAILFLAFSSDLSTSLILLLYSFLILTFILWCWTPSSFSIPRYLYVSAWSRSCITWLSFSGIHSATSKTLYVCRWNCLPLKRQMEKVRRKDSKVEEYNVNDLTKTGSPVMVHESLKPIRKKLFCRKD